MSKANGTKTHHDNYLQHVSLKNYKSIKALEIDFKPGLNIIIGKNGSGKTNFVKGLLGILNHDYTNLLNTDCVIKFAKNEKILEITSHPKSLDQFSILKDHVGKYNRQFALFYEGKKFETNEIDEITKLLIDSTYYFKGNMIEYGIPYLNAKFLQIPGAISIASNGFISVDTNAFIDIGSQFVRQYFLDLFSDFLAPIKGKYVNTFSVDYLKNKIFENSQHAFSYLNHYLLTYASIDKVNINPDFRVDFNDFTNEIVLSNFYFEFKINGRMQPFDFLSDGTKRLFYVISELVEEKENKAVLDNFYRHTNRTTSETITLLEEPELGIHPHQLFKLMEFIKEQSREKQIILTTHSPQVLDVLKADELDRIIICEYDQQKGTQLRHLSEKEITKAKKYMEDEAFLSDYWRFSDLEPA